MRYYIYKNAAGDIVGYNQIDKQLSPPAIEVSKEAFIKLGFYSEQPTVEPAPTPAPAPEADVWDELAAAIQEGVNDV